MLTIFIAIVTIIIGLYIIMWISSTLSKGVCRSQRDLRGRTVIVTGANTGLGLETARGLAARKARVILACRTMSKGRTAAKDITETTGNSNLVVKILDLCSFQSIEYFAKDILENEERLDVLVNNAGVLCPKGEEKSEDGCDLTMATNHFGPFLLTNILLPILMRCAPSRIVVVASMSYKWSRIELDNLNCERKSNSKPDMYGKSKLANILFTRELSRRLSGSGVTVNAVNPGVVRTELTRDMNPTFKHFVRFLSFPISRTAKESAETTIYAAVAEELHNVSGKYFSECKEESLKPHAMDDEVASKLWDASVEITKLDSISFY